MKKKAWFEHLESLDRRIIYLVVFICLIIPYIVTWKLPLPMDTGTKKLFESVERLYKANYEAEAEGKKGKIAVVVVDWEASTKAECLPETVAMMAHLYQRKIPFAILSFYPEGPQFGKLCAEHVRTFGKRRGLDGKMIDYTRLTYGKDYCNWGYKLPDLPVYLALASNMYSIVEADTKGTPIREVPMMKNVDGMHDVGFVFHSSGAPMVNVWIEYIRPQVMFDLGAGVTGIMGPEFTPFLQSGQLSGLMIGMSGAYMYEQRINVEGLGTEGMSGQTVAHIWIILAMILGNIGFVMMKRKAKKEEAEGL